MGQSKVNEWLRKDGENTMPDVPGLIALVRVHRIDLNYVLAGVGKCEFLPLDAG